MFKIQRRWVSPEPNFEPQPLQIFRRADKGYDEGEADGLALRR